MLVYWREQCSQKHPTLDIYQIDSTTIRTSQYIVFYLGQVDQRLEHAYKPEWFANKSL